MLKVGQEVKVKIISIDRDRKRIGLSLRQLKDDPWDDYITAYQVGQLVEGTITRLTKFGAFAAIDENLEGLVHISELSDRRIEHPKEVLNEGDVVTLRIIKIDTNRRRIGLSLRKVESLKYSDLDWETAMAELETPADEEEETSSEAAPEAAAETEVAVEDAAETEVEAEAAAEEESSEEAPAEPVAEAEASEETAEEPEAPPTEEIEA